MVSATWERVAQAHAFLLLRASLGGAWEELYAEHKESPTTLLGLSLVDPDWYEPDTLLGVADPRGPREFRQRPIAGQLCEAVRVWGYECDLLGGTSLQADHFYPYSVGGPTDPRNLVWLCAWHNRVKSGDIHLFAWDQPVAWLDDVLTRVARRRQVLRVHRQGV